LEIRSPLDRPDGDRADAPCRPHDDATRRDVHHRRLRLPEEHRERIEGADTRRVAKDGAGLDRVVRDATVPFPQGDTQLEAGQVRPEASVNARTEGEVAVDVAVPTDVTGVGKLCVVDVGGTDEGEDMVAGLHRA